MFLGLFWDFFGECFFGGLLYWLGFGHVRGVRFGKFGQDLTYCSTHILTTHYINLEQRRRIIGDIRLNISL